MKNGKLLILLSLMATPLFGAEAEALPQDIEEYEQRVSQAFLKVSPEVWKEAALALLLKHGEISLDQITPENFQERLDSLHDYIALLQKGSKEKGIDLESPKDFETVKYQKHFLNGLVQFWRTNPSAGTFPQELYNTLYMPGYQNDQYQHFLTGLENTVKGLKNLLQDSGVTGLDLYRAYCKSRIGENLDREEWKNAFARKLEQLQNPIPSERRAVQQSYREWLAEKAQLGGAHLYSSAQALSRSAAEELENYRQYLSGLQGLEPAQYRNLLSHFPRLPRRFYYRAATDEEEAAALAEGDAFEGQSTLRRSDTDLDKAPF